MPETDFESPNSSADRAPERKGPEPILEVPMEETTIGFFEYDKFDPRPTPGAPTIELPSPVAEFVTSDEEIVASTYKKTVEQEGWDREIVAFTIKYLEGEGRDLAEELGITRVDALTPKQAAGLATEMTARLHKYSFGDRDHEGPTIADQQDAMFFLEQGSRYLHSPVAEAWTGNGVCRNTAATVKAVFEALKAHQSSESQLANTYCVYESDGSYRPPRPLSQSQRNHRSVAIPKPESGHAWNTFVTVESDSVSGVTVDATWGRRDLHTGEIGDVSFTRERMENEVYACGRALNPENPRYREQMLGILGQYADWAKNPPRFRGKASPEDTRSYYTQRAFSLIYRTEFTENLPEEVVSLLREEYLDEVASEDIFRVRALWEISKTSSELDQEELVKSYLADKPSYAIDTVQTPRDMMRALYDHCIERDGAETVIKDSESSVQERVALRELFPDLLPPFDPVNNPVDTDELFHHINQSQYLRSLSPFTPRWKETITPKRLEKVRQVVEEKIEELHGQSLDLSDPADLYQAVRDYEKRRSANVRKERRTTESVSPEELFGV